tara:strand:- start:419 stop:601 length:183 start_codon:yes stop_codon:yes gene_type:complete
MSEETEENNYTEITQRYLLIQQVAKQVCEDVEKGVYEPLECLLEKIPDEHLISFLPEEDT